MLLASPPRRIDEKTGQFSGPLIEILDETAHKIGSSIQWRQAPFQRSLEDLELGLIDIVPRVVLDEKRKAFVAYLGPIGYQEKDIVFLVRKGAENSINSYEDLKKITHLGLPTRAPPRALARRVDLFQII